MEPERRLAPRRMSDSGVFIADSSETGSITKSGRVHPVVESNQAAVIPAIVPIIRGFLKRLRNNATVFTFSPLIVSKRITARILYMGTTTEAHTETIPTRSGPQTDSTIGIANKITFPLYPP